MIVETVDLIWVNVSARRIQSLRSGPTSESPRFYDRLALVRLQSSANVKDDAMAKKSKSKAKKTKRALTSKPKEIRDISEMLDSIRLDWKDLSKKPVAIRHTRGVKKLLRWCEEELKALRKYYNETDA
jgi:hypothetical protein